MPDGLGSDKIRGRDGKDCLDGIVAGAGNDSVYGMPGNDEIAGVDGDASLRGGTGCDVRIGLNDGGLISITGADYDVTPGHGPSMVGIGSNGGEFRRARYADPICDLAVPWPVIPGPPKPFNSAATTRPYQGWGGERCPAAPRHDSGRRRRQAR